MAKVYGIAFYQNLMDKCLTAEKSGLFFLASNGLRRPTLFIETKSDDIKELCPNKPITAKVSYIVEGNHASIILDKSDKTDKTIGIVGLKAFGYELQEKDKAIFEYSSDGGPGNSESKIGIYEVGAVIKINTYKNRTAPFYYILTEDGWKYGGTKANILANIENDDIAKKLAKVLNLSKSQIKSID